MELQNCLEYRQIPAVKKGIRAAFAAGWNAKETGAKNPYLPRTKDFLATNPYFSAFELGKSCNPA